MNTLNSNVLHHPIWILSHHHNLQLQTQHLTYPSLISSSYKKLNSRSLTLQLHSLTLKLSLSSNCKTHLYNSLIQLYSTTHHLNSALQLFDQMPHQTRDVVTYTTIISASVYSNHFKLALNVFDSMHVPPNEATLASVLKACACLGALGVGRKVHCVATQLGFLCKRNVVTALIDMYCKCGRIDIAERMFDRLLEKDLYSWTAMIAGLASHGMSREAIDLFDRMNEFGLRPTEKTITSALSACRSSGWVDEGFRIYNGMCNFGIKPNIKHCGCMVDLLARTGHLEEAEEFIRMMSVKTDSMLWRNLIWASKFHGDMDRAKRLIEETENMELDSGSGDSYVLKENVYASNYNWDEKGRIRELMIKRKVKKLPGWSRIEIEGVIHEFDAGDSKHPMREEIYRKWEEILARLTINGYIPKISEVMLDIDDEEKISQLNHHSEKLALAFGLISTKQREEILILKNLRACQDCHNAMKFVSKIYDRNIIVRDRIKFHHFSNGVCSCGDYW